jgi:hypothetical protein
LDLTENQFVMETLSILYFGEESAQSQGKSDKKCHSYVKEKMFDIQTFV